MGIAGNLKTMEFAELLQWVSQGAKTGTLVIDNGEVEKRIVFQKGRVIATASTNPAEYLGHTLVSHGFLDEKTLAEAVARQDVEKKMFGKILIELGAISAPDLDRMLRLQSEETIYDVFPWPEGEFRFLDDELPSYPLVPLQLDVTHLVLEGVQRLDEWKRIRDVITSPKMVPVAVGPLAAPEDDPQARLVLEAVDDDRTIEEIALHLHTSEFQVCRVLFEEIRARRIKVVRPRPVASDAPVLASGNGIDVGALLETAGDLAKRGAFEQALRHLRAAQSLEPDDPRVREQMTRTEGAVTQRLEEAGIRPHAVPKLARPLAELSQIDLSPQEGFILSRINDAYDVGTIVKISPLPSLDARLVVFRLLEAGHITLQRGRRP